MIILERLAADDTACCYRGYFAHGRAMVPRGRPDDLAIYVAAGNACHEHVPQDCPRSHKTQTEGAIRSSHKQTSLGPLVAAHAQSSLNACLRSTQTPDLLALTRRSIPCLSPRLRSTA